MPDTLSTVDVLTRRYINTQPKLRDLVYNKDPLMSMLDSDCMLEIDGGSSWNFDIEYDVQDGGWYKMGSDLPATDRQIEQQLRFDPKFQTALITFQKEKIKVINNGAEAIIKMVESRVDSGFKQLGAQTAIQLYMQGATGTFDGAMNGLTEALGGAVAGWDGATYPVYGTLTRANYGGRMLSSPPLDLSAGGGQSISLPTLEKLYSSVNFGSGEYEPNAIITTVLGMSYLRNNYQTQQRFQNVTVAKGGFRGLEYNGATVLSSRYAPGSYLSANSGLNDKVASRLFTYSSKGATTGYPIGNLGANGETLWVLNVRPPMVQYCMSSNDPFNGNLDDDGFCLATTYPFFPATTPIAGASAAKRRNNHGNQRILSNCKSLRLRRFQQHQRGHSRFPRRTWLRLGGSKHRASPSASSGGLSNLQHRRNHRWPVGLLDRSRQQQSVE
jgi:hypothetical protein